MILQSVNRYEGYAAFSQNVRRTDGGVA